MRMIEMELPDADGVRQSQLVHYLLYRVRYLGNDLLPEQERVEAGTGIPKEPARTVADSVLFVPRFTWISTQQKQELPEKILPLVKGPIAARERVGKPLLDSFEMIRKIQQTTPESNNEYWGVATWTGIDPSIDFFAIQVEGLTNAYRIVEVDGNRKFEKKRLQINFWRPGDGIASEADRIRLGAPAFEQPERVEYALRQLGLKERMNVPLMSGDWYNNFPGSGRRWHTKKVKARRATGATATHSGWESRSLVANWFSLVRSSSVRRGPSGIPGAMSASEMTTRSTH